jgi:multicomponent Na+:H+ antiporter subunit E
MVTRDAVPAPRFAIGVICRFAFYLALWAILISGSTIDLLIGLVTAACATWLSMVLLPVENQPLSMPALARFAVRLPWQSLIAGADVARRALDPRLPLRTGFIDHGTGLDAGWRRDGFRVLVSLQPGTLPVSTGETGNIVVHCLDTSQPIQAQLAAEEAMFAQLINATEPVVSGHG